MDLLLTKLNKKIRFYWWKFWNFIEANLKNLGVYWRIYLKRSDLSGYLVAVGDNTPYHTHLGYPTELKNLPYGNTSLPRRDERGLPPPGVSSRFSLFEKMIICWLYFKLCNLPFGIGLLSLFKSTEGQDQNMSNFAVLTWLVTRVSKRTKIGTHIFYRMQSKWVNVSFTQSNSKVISFDWIGC